jgi:hypothetical protein
MFWTPRPGSVVNVAEALRSYATVPESLRSQAWSTLQESENDLRWLMQEWRIT